MLQDYENILRHCNRSNILIYQELTVKLLNLIPKYVFSTVFFHSLK